MHLTKLFVPLEHLSVKIKEENELNSILLSSKIVGKIVKDKNGKEFLRFSSILKDPKNESLAHLSDDEKLLIGETIGEISKGEKEVLSVRYSWTAKLAPLKK